MSADPFFPCSKITDDDLGIQGVGASAAMLLNHFGRNIPASAIDGSVSVCAITALRHSVEMSNISPSQRSLRECPDEPTFYGC